MCIITPGAIVELYYYDAIRNCKLNTVPYNLDAVSSRTNHVRVLFKRIRIHCIPVA